MTTWQSDQERMVLCSSSFLSGRTTELVEMDTKEATTIELGRGNLQPSFKICTFLFCANCLKQCYLPLSKKGRGYFQTVKGLVKVGAFGNSSLVGVRLRLAPTLRCQSTRSKVLKHSLDPWNRDEILQRKEWIILENKSVHQPVLWPKPQPTL